MYHKTNNQEIGGSRSITDKETAYRPGGKGFKSSWLQRKVLLRHEKWGLILPAAVTRQACLFILPCASVVVTFTRQMHKQTSIKIKALFMITSAIFCSNFHRLTSVNGI